MLDAFDGWVDTTDADQQITRHLHRIHTDHYRRALTGAGFGGQGQRPRRLRLFLVIQRDARIDDLRGRLARLRPGVSGTGSSGPGGAARALDLEVLKVEQALGEIPLAHRRLPPDEVLQLLRSILTAGHEHRTLPAYDPLRPPRSPARDRVHSRPSGTGSGSTGPARCGCSPWSSVPPRSRPGSSSSSVVSRESSCSSSTGTRSPTPRSWAGISRKEEIARRVNAFRLKNPEAEAFEREAETYREEALGQEFVYGACHLVLWGADRGELDRGVTAARAVFQRKELSLRGKFKWHVEDWAAPEVLRQALPGGYRPDVDERYTGRRLTYEAQQFVSLPPILKPPRRVAQQFGHLFLSEAGEPAALDLFGSGPPHGLIVGSSGGGKSVLAGALMTTARRLGAPRTGRSVAPAQFVIDIRETYHRVVDYLGGRRYHFDIRTAYCLNPLHRPAIGPDGEPDRSELAFQGSIVLSMIEGEGERVGRLEAGIVKKALERTHRDFLGRDRAPRLSDLLERFDHPSLREEFGELPARFGRQARLMVHDYTRMGSYGAIIDADYNLDLDHDLQLFNLAGLEEYPELQSLIVKCLIHAIQAGVRTAHREGRRSYVWLDEVWNLLGSSDVATKFLHEAYRAYRHLGGSITCISQSPGDFEGEVGRPIRANTGSSFFLPMKEEDLTACRISLQLTEIEYARIAELRTEPGKWSRFFLRSSEASGTFLYPCPPFLYWLLATDGEDVALLNEVMDRLDGDLHAAMTELAERYPMGARGLRTGAAPTP